MRRVLLLATAMTMLASGPALAASLVNGGFEQPGGLAAAFLPPGSTYITGWTTVDATPGGDSDVQYSSNASFGSYGVVASEGTHYLDLTGVSGRGKGVISNAVAVNAGEKYRVAFDVGAFFVAGQGSYGDATVDLLVNGLLAGSFTNTMDLKAAGSDWRRFSYDFTAASPSVRLTFLSSTSLASSSLGVGLDNVTFESLGGAPVGSAVPEPATWAMMIAGFGLAGASLRRRRAILA